jgi:hypothetical protein
MSDTVLVALIAGAPGVVASILGFLNQIMIRRAADVGQKAAIIGEKAAAIGEKAVVLGARAAELGAKNEQHLAETKEAMILLEKNTNSIKDELVKTTALASRAAGNLEGRAEQKAEHKRDSEEHSGPKK